MQCKIFVWVLRSPWQRMECRMGPWIGLFQSKKSQFLADWRWKTPRTFFNVRAALLVTDRCWTVQPSNCLQSLYSGFVLGLMLRNQTLSCRFNWSQWDFQNYWFSKMLIKYRQPTDRIQTRYRWNTDEIPLRYWWNTNELPAKYWWNTEKYWYNANNHWCWFLTDNKQTMSLHSWNIRCM